MADAQPLTNLIRDPALGDTSPLSQISPLHLFTLNTSTSATPLSQIQAPETISANQYNDIPEGAYFRAPNGKRLQKPYRLKSWQQIGTIPEGSAYIDLSTDPENVMTSPKLKPIDTITDVLYNIASTPEQRMDVLKHAYGEDAVSNVPGYKYPVIKDGKVWRAPNHGRLPQQIFSTVLPEVPYIGTALAAEALFPPAMPFNILSKAYRVAKVAGATGVATEGLNEGTLELFGTQPVDPEDYVKNAAIIAGTTALGNVAQGIFNSLKNSGVLMSKSKEAGKAFANGKPDENIAKIAKSIIDSIPPEYAKVITTMIGTTEENLAHVERLLAAGGLSFIHPHTYAPESPMLNVYTNFAAMFNKDNKIINSILAFYQGAADRIAKINGATIGSVISGITSPNYEQLGRQAIKELKQYQQQHNDLTVLHDQIAESFAKERAGVITLIEQEKAARAAQINQYKQLFAEYTNAGTKAIQTSLQGIIDNQLKDLQQLVSSPRELVDKVNKQFEAVYRQFQNKSDELYTKAYTTAGDTPIPKELLRSLEAQHKYILNLFPQSDPALTPYRNVVEDAYKHIVDGTINFTQMHSLYKLIKQGISFSKLPNDYKTHMEKAIVYSIKNVLTHPGEVFDTASNVYRTFTKNVPENLRLAANELRLADAFNAANRAQFNSRLIDATRNLLNAKMPPDPERLAGILFDEPFTVSKNEWLKTTLGAPLVNATVQADFRRILLSHSVKTTINGLEEIKYDLKGAVNEIGKRINEKYYEGAISKEEMKTFTTMQTWLDAHEGTININAEKGDTVLDWFSKAKEADAKAEQLAHADPISVFVNGIDTHQVPEEWLKSRSIAEQEAHQNAAQLQKELEADPLYAMSKMGLMTHKAGEMILNSKDLLDNFIKRHGFVKATVTNPDGSTYATEANELSPATKMIKSLLLQKVLQASSKIGDILNLQSRIVSAGLGPVINNVTGEQMLSYSTQKLFGLSVKDIWQLAEDLIFIAPPEKEFGSALAGAARVINPLKHVGSIGKEFSKASLPIMLTGTVIARAGLGKLYDVIMDVTNSPEWFSMLRRGVNAKSAATSKEMSQMIQQIFNNKINATKPSPISSVLGSMYGRPEIEIEEPQ